MAGLLGDGFDDPRSAAMMALAGGLLQGNFGGGLLGANDAYAQAKQGLLKQKLTQAQLDNYASEIETRKAALQRAKETQDWQNNFFAGKLPGMAAPRGPVPDSAFSPAADGMGPTMPQSMQGQSSAMSMLGQLNEDQMLQAIAQGKLPAGSEKLWELAKFGKDYKQGDFRVFSNGDKSMIPMVKEGLGYGPEGVSVLPGAAQSQATLAGAVTGAQEAAKDPFAPPTMVNTPGGPRLMTPAQARAYANGGLQPSPRPQLGSTSNPAPGNPFANLPPAEAGVSGAFKGDPAQVISSIANIKDPQERANAYAAFAQQMKTSGGNLRADDMPGGALKTPAQEAADAAQKASLVKSAEATAGDVAEQRKSIMNAGFTAPANIAKYKQLGTLLSDVDGGKLTQTGTNIASMANSLGLKIDKNLPNKEAAAALGNQMALELRSPAGGAGMPGAMSDKDREFLQGMVPNAGQTTQGRKMLIDSYVAVQQRNQQVATFARNYEKKYGRLDNGFFEQMQAWSNANPLFGGK